MSVKMAGQTINDRLLAARHSLAGQGLAKSVCKATTEEMIGPKKKHLDYLIHCTNEPNVSIPQMANLLIERSQNANWIVVFKALITVHHLLCYGNERFTQYLASSNSTFQLSNFLDKSGVQGARVGYDMSPYIRRYAKYLNEKALSYRTVAFDFCKVKRGKEDGTLRTMNAEKLLKTLPVLQSQLDALLEFDCTANDLTNGVINMAFMLLFRDLIRLFACYNDGIINLLEKYFDMNKKQCRDALDLYKKFLIRMDRVAEFLKVAENVGIDKGDIPDLTKAPSSLLDALEQHLASLEGKKGSAANTPTQAASNRTNVKSGVSALSSTSTAFGTAAANTRLDSQTNGIDESLKQQVLAEEEAAMNQYKAKVSSPTSSTNPFLSSPTPVSNSQQPIVDLFGSPPGGSSDPSQAAVRASDDLLQLGNPFADMFGGAQQAAPAPAPQTDMWLTNGYKTAPVTSNAFVSDQSFNSVFGNAGQAVPAASSGMAAPNPFAADFGGQPPPSSGPQGITDGSGASDLFVSSFGQGGSQEQDLFGSISVGDDAAPVSDTGSKNALAEDNILLEAGSDGILPEQSASQPFANIMPQFPPAPAPSPVGNKVETSAPPPPRPPPPSGARTDSPAPLLAASSPSRQPPASKSAFDDLNDSIRAALGGSPSRTALPTASGVAATPPVGYGASMAGFGGFDVGVQGMTTTVGGGGLAGSAPIGFGSPNKQGMSMMTGFDAFGDVLRPHALQSMGPPPVSAAGMGVPGGVPQTGETGKVLTGDLDSSLASLAENLTINKGASTTVKGVQWNSPKNVAKAGATGWTPQPMAATTGANYRPMGSGMASVNSTPVFPGMQPMGMQGMRPMGAAPMMGGTGMMGGGAGMMGSPRMGSTPVMGQQTTQIPSMTAQQPLDPFGAL